MPTTPDPLPDGRRTGLRLVAGLIALGGLLLASGVFALLLLPSVRMLLLEQATQWVFGSQLERLVAVFDLSPEAARVLTLLALPPLATGLWMALSFRRARATAGVSILFGLLLVASVAAWFQSRNFHFDDTGRPLVYLSFRREGVHRSYRPGLDPVTGQPKVPVTLDRIAWFTELARQPVVELDPARFTPWFDPNSGSPNLWYFQTASNRWRFYNRPHFHGQSQVQAKPITRAIMDQWQAQHTLDLAEQARLEAQRREEAEARAATLRLQEQQLLAAAEARARAEAEALAERNRQLEIERQRELAQARAEAEALAERTRQIALERDREMARARAEAEIRARLAEEERMREVAVAEERRRQIEASNRAEAERQAQARLAQPPPTTRIRHATPTSIHWATPTPFARPNPPTRAERPRTAIGLPLNSRGETPLGTLFMAPFRLVGGAVTGMSKALGDDSNPPVHVVETRPNQGSR